MSRKSRSEYMLCKSRVLMPTNRSSRPPSGEWVVYQQAQSYVISDAEVMTYHDANYISLYPSASDLIDRILWATTCTFNAPEWAHASLSDAAPLNQLAPRGERPTLFNAEGSRAVVAAVRTRSINRRCLAIPNHDAL